MKVTAWKNGKHKALNTSYGLRITKEDRDRFFRKSWGSVFISLPGKKVETALNVKKASFWNDSCRQLIGREVKEWLVGNDYVPWPYRQPPKFQLIQKYDNHFQVHFS